MCTRRALVMALLALGVLFAPAAGFHPATAQVVWATLVGRDDGQPVRKARVYLVRDDGITVDSTTSDAYGRARLAADSAGRFVLYAHLEGFAAYTSPPFRLHVHEMIQQRFTLPLVSIAAMRRMGETLRNDPTLQRSLSTICGEQPRPGTSVVVGVVRARGGGIRAGRPGAADTAGQPAAPDTAGQPAAPDTAGQPVAADTEGGPAGPVPLGGALVSLTPLPPEPKSGEEAPERPPARPITAVSNAHGTYVLCNVPEGDALLRTRAAGWQPDDVRLRVRPGVVLWRDVLLNAAAAAPAPPPATPPTGPPGEPPVLRHPSSG